MDDVKRLRVTLKRSLAGHRAEHRETARLLGLRKINDTAVLPDQPAQRGMIRKISFLVSVEEVASDVSDE